MKGAVKLLSLADRYAGLFLVSALSLAAGREGKAPPAAPRMILVMKFWEGGVIVIGGRYFRALGLAFPGAEIDFLTLDINSELAAMTGAFGRISVLRIRAGFAAFCLDAVRAFFELRSRRYDIVLDLEFLSRFSSVFTFLLAPGFSAGFGSGRYWRGNLHSAEAAFLPDAHMTRNFDAVFGAIGVSPEEGPPRLEVEEGWPAPTPAPKKYIVVNADRTPLIPERNWPAPQLTALLKSLSGLEGFRVVAVSGAESVLDGVALPPGVEHIRGLSFRRLGGLLKGASLFITHDSGPMHMAEALGVPLVALFGPETPERYGPRSPSSRVIYRNPGCSPCIDVLDAKRVRCVRSSNECMAAITPEEVLAAAAELLGRGGA